jgi:hypothetical protein
MEYYLIMKAIQERLVLTVTFVVRTFTVSVND